MVNSFTTASSKDIFCLFLGGLGCVGHSFASVAYYVFLEMWIWTHRAAIASRCATNLCTHLSYEWWPTSLKLYSHHLSANFAGRSFISGNTCFENSVFACSAGVWSLLTVQHHMVNKNLPYHALLFKLKWHTSVSSPNEPWTLLGRKGGTASSNGSKNYCLLQEFLFNVHSRKWKVCFTCILVRLTI